MVGCHGASSGYNYMNDVHAHMSKLEYAGIIGSNTTIHRKDFNGR